jgi:FtsP/CotA-like multicopper oxidase with cupredoxin domain
MSITRRTMMTQAATALVGGAVAAGSGAATLAAGSKQKETPRPIGEIKPAWTKPALAPGIAGTDYKPVVTPNGVALPFRIVNGVKVFHLIAEEVEHHFVKEVKAKCWGFNGRVHGPTLEAVEGDHVRIYVTNNLPTATSIHWHAIILPNGMDGVGGVTQKVINPGETNSRSSSTVRTCIIHTMTI